MPAFKKLINAIRQKFKIVGHLKGLDGRELRIRSEHSSVNLLFQSAGAIIMKQTLINFWKTLLQQGYVHQEDYLHLMLLEQHQYRKYYLLILLML